MNFSESVKQKIPVKFKPFFRLLFRCLQLLYDENVRKDFKIRFSQVVLLWLNYSPSSKKVIIFLSPGHDIVNGGIMSIASIYKESVKLKRIHDSEVIMCTVPGDRPLLKYTKFENQNYIYEFSNVLSFFKNAQNLLIHIPECAITKTLKNIKEEDFVKLNGIKEIHYNIMLQNIKLLSPLKDIERLKELGKVTCTTAHEKYSSSAIRKKLGIPLHKLSVFVSPEQYKIKPYIEKENLMIISPDSYFQKEEILNLIYKQLPHIKLQIIQNLTYSEYKNVINRAKWALTFGEGLDGYFIEPIFSGGISFAVYNSEFFTADFKTLRTVYDSYEALTKNICQTMIELDNEIAFKEYQVKQYKLACKYYNYNEYAKNLESFYLGRYTYE